MLVIDRPFLFAKLPVVFTTYSGSVQIPAGGE